MKRNLIVLFLWVIVPSVASSQTILTPIQSDNLVRLINDYESLKERHAIVIGRLTEAEEIIWKYGDMINECDRLRVNAEDQSNELVQENSRIKKRTKLISVISFGIGVILTIFITS